MSSYIVLTCLLSTLLAAGASSCGQTCQGVACAPARLIATGVPNGLDLVVTVTGPGGVLRATRCSAHVSSWTCGFDGCDPGDYVVELTAGTAVETIRIHTFRNECGAVMQRGSTRTVDFSSHFADGSGE